jgi:hypothetical protein
LSRWGSFWRLQFIVVSTHGKRMRTRKRNDVYLWIRTANGDFRSRTHFSFLFCEKLSLFQYRRRNKRKRITIQYELGHWKKRFCEKTVIQMSVIQI